MKPARPASAALALALLLAVSVSWVQAARADWPVGGVPVSVASGAQSSPDAVADGTSGAFVVWQDSRSGNADIWCQRLTRAGAPAPGWPAGGIGVCTAAANQVAPRLCPDGTGGVYVAWTDQTSGTAQSDIRLQHVTADGAIAAGWPLPASRGLVASDAVGKQSGPSLVPDGAGGVFVTWLDGRTGAVLMDVGLAHVLPDGSLATGWPVNGLDLFRDSYSQLQPGLVPDAAVAGEGGTGCFLVFSDRRNYGIDPAYGEDIFLMRFSSAAVVEPGFSPVGNDLTANLGDQAKPVLVADGAGGVLVVWTDTRTSPEANLSATRIRGDGSTHPGWAALGSGLALTTAAGTQDEARGVPDGAGGAILVWRDSGAPPNLRLRATRATGEGAIAAGWPTAGAGGLAVCSVDSDQQQHDIVADGSGGAIVAWRDGRNASADIYAARVNGDGAFAPGWPSEGVAVCTLDGAQSTPSVVADGAGGAFVFWSDQRGDTGDLYAAHVTAAGDPAPVAGVPPAAAARFALSLASANPARGGGAFALALPAPAVASVDVLDLSGRRVRSLLAGEALPAGTRSLAWDGRDDSGRSAPAGLYFVAARAGGEHRVVRIALGR